MTAKITKAKILAILVSLACLLSSCVLQGNKLLVHASSVSEGDLIAAEAIYGEDHVSVSDNMVFYGNAEAFYQSPNEEQDGIMLLADDGSITYELVKGSPLDDFPEVDGTQYIGLRYYELYCSTNGTTIVFLTTCNYDHWNYSGGYPYNFYFDKSNTPVTILMRDSSGYLGSKIVSTSSSKIISSNNFPVDNISDLSGSKKFTYVGQGTVKGIEITPDVPEEPEEPEDPSGNVNVNIDIDNRSIFEKPLEEYNTVEGLLLIISLILLGNFIHNFVGGFVWHSF